MKKILFVLICIMFFIDVKALTTYGEWTTDIINEPYEKEERCKYYHEIKEGEYKIKDESIDLLVDYNDYITTTTEWLDIKPEELPDQEIEIRNVYEYKKALPITNITINNVIGSYGSLRISEIIIYDDNRIINYSYTCDGCNSSFNDYINNGIINENFSHIKNGGNIIITLDEEVDYDKLKIIFYVYDVTNTNKSFDISFNNNFNDTYYSYHFNNNFISDLNNMYEILFSYENMTLNEIKWSNYEFSIDKVIPDNVTSVKENIQYKVTNKYYYYYNIKKEYSDILSEYYNNSECITYYRAILEVEDNQNVEYKNINENINQYNELIEQLNEKIIEISNLNLLVNKYKSDLDIKEHEKQIMKKEYENTIFNMKLEKEDIKCEEVNIEEKKGNNYIYIIICVFIISLILIIIPKRKTSFVEKV